MHYLTGKVANSSLYQTVFDDGYVVWVPLPWSDYKKLREARIIRGPSLDYDLEQYVYNRCVLSSSFDESPPEDYDDVNKLAFQEDCRSYQPAGITSTVVKTILQFSGALKAETIIDQLESQRQSINNIEDQLTVMICRAFPGYTPEDIEKMDWQTVLKRAAQAEAIGLNLTPELPIRITKPAELEKQRRAGMFDIEKEMREMGRELGPSPEQVSSSDQEAQRARSKEQAKLREQYLRQKGMR